MAEKGNGYHDPEDAEKELDALDSLAEREEIADLEVEEIPPEEREAEEPEEESDPVERLETLLAESDERYLRIVAEYENYRKRTSKEKSELFPLATCETVARFLPILDNFERAMEYEQGTEEYAKGMQMIHENFHEVLKSLGAEPVGEVGEPFDPALHNAVMHIDDESLGKNVVSMVMQKGYRIGDRIVRHAMVQTAN